MEPWERLADYVAEAAERDAAVAAEQLARPSSRREWERVWRDALLDAEAVVVPLAGRLGVLWHDDAGCLVLWDRSVPWGQQVGRVRERDVRVPSEYGALAYGQWRPDGIEWRDSVSRIAGLGRVSDRILGTAAGRERLVNRVIAALQHGRVLPWAANPARHTWSRATAGLRTGGVGLVVAALAQGEWAIPMSLAWHRATEVIIAWLWVMVTAAVVTGDVGASAWWYTVAEWHTHRQRARHE